MLEDLIFAAGSAFNSEEDFTFTIIDDQLCESAENILLDGSVLSPSDRGTFVGGSSVIINDNDGK